jgi:hypothetical protein
LNARTWQILHRIGFEEQDLPVWTNFSEKEIREDIIQYLTEIDAGFEKKDITRAAYEVWHHLRQHPEIHIAVTDTRPTAF